MLWAAVVAINATIKMNRLFHNAAFKSKGQDQSQKHSIRGDARDNDGN